MAKIVSGPSKGIEGELITYNSMYCILKVDGKIKQFKPSTIQFTKKEYKKIINDKDNDFHNFYKPVEGEYRFMKSFMNRVVAR